MANKKDEDFQKGQSFDSIFTPADPAIFVCRGGSHEKGVAMGMWSLSSSGPPFTLLVYHSDNSCLICVIVSGQAMLLEHYTPDKGRFDIVVEHFEMPCSL